MMFGLVNNNCPNQGRVGVAGAVEQALAYMLKRQAIPYLRKAKTVYLVMEQEEGTIS